MRPCESLGYSTIHRTIAATNGPTTAFTGPGTFLYLSARVPRGVVVAPQVSRLRPGIVASTPAKRVLCVRSHRAPRFLDYARILVCNVQCNRRSGRSSMILECIVVDFHDGITVTDRFCELEQTDQQLWSRIRDHGDRRSSRLPRFDFSSAVSFSTVSLERLLACWCRGIEYCCTVQYRAITRIPLWLSYLEVPVYSQSIHGV